jgi:hypothetical protein
MINQIQILQKFSMKEFNMKPITIKQLLMIDKEYKSYCKRVGVVGIHQY